MPEARPPPAGAVVGGRRLGRRSMTPARCGGMTTKSHSNPAPTGTEIAPFLRWAGGKRKLVPVLREMLPASFDPTKARVFEPFVGGGAFMLGLGDPSSTLYVPGKRLVINDANPELVATYRALRDDVDAVIRALGKLAKDTSKPAFERQKALAPKNDVQRAARFIFLNRTCFNGLWRVNGSGKFNVPFGNLDSPFIFSADQLRAVSARLEKCQIRSGSYVQAVNDAKAGDLVYLDPPYIPLTPSSSFSKYAKEDFGSTDHYALAGVIRALTDRGVFVMLSNSDTPLTRHVFGEELDLWQISVARSISASGSSRAKVNEVIGANFSVQGAPSSVSHISTPARTLLV
jgi:DNA adenine methylase